MNLAKRFLIAAFPLLFGFNASAQVAATRIPLSPEVKNFLQEEKITPVMGTSAGKKNMTWPLLIDGEKDFTGPEVQKLYYERKIPGYVFREVIPDIRGQNYFLFAGRTQYNAHPGLEPDIYYAGYDANHNDTVDIAELKLVAMADDEFAREEGILDYPTLDGYLAAGKEIRYNVLSAETGEKIYSIAIDNNADSEPEPVAVKTPPPVVQKEPVVEVTAKPSEKPSLPPVVTEKPVETAPPPVVVVDTVKQEEPKPVPVTDTVKTPEVIPVPVETPKPVEVTSVPETEKPVADKTTAPAEEKPAGTPRTYPYQDMKDLAPELESFLKQNSKDDLDRFLSRAKRADLDMSVQQAMADSDAVALDSTDYVATAIIDRMKGASAKFSPGLLYLIGKDDNEDGIIQKSELRWVIEQVATSRKDGSDILRRFNVLSLKDGRKYTLVHTGSYGLMKGKRVLEP